MSNLVKKNNTHKISALISIKRITKIKKDIFSYKGIFYFNGKIVSLIKSYF